MNDDVSTGQPEIEVLAERAFATIPKEFRDQLRDVVIQVVDLPDEETCHDLDLESPLDLLGLYRGVPLDERSVLDVPQHMDTIFLYRLSLLRYAQDTGEDLYNLVHHVLVHEIGHHYGFSDAEMEAIESER
ncbi:MAG: metallopeptidase family protein [Alphaproteobacteria bacterium]|nr:metallopeptidase family protein [Alphaproteobacteria bacterium]